MSATSVRFDSRRWLAGGVTGVLILGGSGVALAMNGSAGQQYRLATATVASVDQRLASVGTVAAVNRAVLAFPVAGTVAAVPVTLGERVSAGQLLASLSTTALQQQVAAAVAVRAADQQALAADESSQTGTAVSGSGSASTADQAASTAATASTAPVAVTSPPASTPVRSSGATGRAGPAAGRGTASSAIGQAQQQLLRAQQRVDRDLSAAEDALALCQADLSQLPTSSSSATPSVSPSATPSTSPSGTPSTTGTVSGPQQVLGHPTSGPPSPVSGGVPGCLDAIAEAPSKARTTADEAARNRAETALDSAIRAALSATTVQAAGSSGSSGNASRAGTGSGNSNTGSVAAGSSSRTGTGTGSARAASGPASAEQLAADQAQLDAAQAELAVSQQNVAEARLTSPMAGTVAAISLQAGHAVSAGSSSATITVIGAGQESVTTTVALADVDSVKVGDHASVRVDGISSQLAGTVSAIGILNTTTGSSTSYPVTILLAPTSTHLYDGSGASVQIAVTSVTNVLTVPSSAVRTVGQLSTVTVLSKGKPVPTRITVGAVGTDRTQVTSGLSPGTQVVLANLTAPLPSGTG